MADERDKEQFDSEGKSGRQTTDQEDQQRHHGATGSEPPRSMGTKGSEFGQFGDSTGPAGQQGQSGTGQSDLGTQADTTLAGRSDQQDLGTDQPGRVGGAGQAGSTAQSGSQGEGFIGSQRGGSDEYLQEGASATGASGSSAAGATGGEDFARQGQGALEGDEEDIEGGQRRTGEFDIERP